MPPGQNMNVTNPSYHTYTRKDFQGKCIYSHKKFGHCFSSTTPPRAVRNGEKHSLTDKGTQAIDTTTIQRPTLDLFRPYALPDHTSNKRKRHEFQSDESSEEYCMKSKIFAYSSSPTPCNTLPSTSSAFSTYNTEFINPHYGLQQYQFNPQIFSLILYKQSAAMYLGEIIKKQGNLAFYNLMEQPANP